MERTRDDLKALAKTLLECGGGHVFQKVLKEYGVDKLSGIEDVDLGVCYDFLSAEYEKFFLAKRPLKKFERFKYGRIWGSIDIEKKGKNGKAVREPLRPLLDVEIEMKMFLLYEQGQAPLGGLGDKGAHAKLGMEMIWSPSTKKPFTDNPYSRRMMKGFCEHQFLAIAGHASGGKTYNPAAWGIWNFLCDPWNTMVLVTSTTLKDSKGRIWGDIEEFWDVADEYFTSLGLGGAPGKKVSSSGLIRCVLNGKESPKAGLSLVAGDKSEAAKSWNKIKGFKRDRFFFICDEMTDLSENLISSAEGNLRSNPHFQMICIGNPASYYDPLGKFCEPKNGWSSVNESMYEWEGKKAYVMRFDAKTSPNVLARRNIYTGLLPYEKYDEAKLALGENSPNFYQMYRGFWCPTGAVESIYNESEIILYGADKPCGHGWNWMGDVTWVWGLDPAFKNGGDDAILTLGRVGKNTNGLTVFERMETIVIHTDVNLMENGNVIPRDTQVVRTVGQILLEKRISIVNGAIDISGAATFGTYFSTCLGQGWIPVEFGGSASDMPVSNIDHRPAKEVYNRMVAEIWHVGKELLRNGQIKGLDPDTIRQMVDRTYSMVAGKIRVMPKEEMKKLIGRSPDRADSLFICLHAARKRVGLTSTEKAKGVENAPSIQKKWENFCQQMDIGSFSGQTFTYG